MIIPFWFWIPWTVTKLAYGALAFLILRERLSLKWPSLLLLCLDELVMYVWLGFCILHRAKYALYFNTFWFNANYVATAIRIWVALDIVRSIPAIGAVSPKIKASLVGFGAIGIGVAFLIAFSDHPHAPQSVAVAFSQAVTTGWIAAFCACVYGIAAAGFGYLRPTLRIMTGVLVDTCVSAVISRLAAVPGHHPHLRTAIQAANLSLGVFIAAYYCYSIAHDNRDIREFRDELNSTQPSPSRES